MPKKEAEVYELPDELVRKWRHREGLLRDIDALQAEADGIATVLRENCTVHGLYGVRDDNGALRPLFEVAPQNGFNLEFALSMLTPGQRAACLASPPEGPVYDTAKVKAQLSPATLRIAMQPKPGSKNKVVAK